MAEQRTDWHVVTNIGRHPALIAEREFVAITNGEFAAYVWQAPESAQVMCDNLNENARKDARIAELEEALRAAVSHMDANGWHGRRCVTVEDALGESCSCGGSALQRIARAALTSTGEQGEGE